MILHQQIRAFVTSTESAWDAILVRTEAVNPRQGCDEAAFWMCPQGKVSLMQLSRSKMGAGIICTLLNINNMMQVRIQSYATRDSCNAAVALPQ